MSSDSLPLGYRIRKAKFTDLPQLLVQIFLSNPLSHYIQLKNHLSFIFFTIAFIGFMIGFNLAIDAHEYANSYSIKLTLPIENILYKWGYRISDDSKDYDSLLHEIASLSGTVYALIFIAIAAIIFAIFFICITYCEAWVLEANKQVIASVRFSYYTSKFENIYVKPKFRRQGFASYLIKYIQTKFKSNLFVTCHPKLIPFFEHLGFIKDLESQRQFAWGKGKSLIPMCHPNNKIELTDIENQIVLKQEIDKFDIYSVSKNYIDDINKINIFNKTIDYFLPFGVNFIWMDNIIIWLFRSMAWYLLLRYKTIVSSTMYQSFGLFINIYLLFLLFLMLFSLILSPSTIFGRCQYFYLQKHQQFILIEYENRIIGYARLLKKRKYSIVNHLYIPTSIEAEIISHLIQRIVDKIAQPILIACTTQELETYKSIGFKQIDIQKMPKKMRFGGWLNQLFGGKNLVYIPKK
ncbi:MAG: GNAT family N-acetyltransferase [Rivularia sp. (in: cyanobacteria)]